MKRRNGFVSNSSSASFIIHWRIKGFGEEFSIKEAILKLMDSYRYFVEEDKFVPLYKENTENEESIKEKTMMEEIEKDTVKNKDGSYTTTFYTYMKNSMDDFGEAAKSMTIALVGNDKFEIVDSKVDGEE